jgi:Flp pilus assembly protein TadG
VNRRGSTLLEPALITSLFLTLLMGITDFGRMGCAYSSLEFAAHRTARWASTRGSSSGHAATLATAQAEAQTNLTALDNTQLTVGVTWSPNNNPGSTVEVQLTYNFKTLLIPISSKALKLKSTSTQIIIQ